MKYLSRFAAFEAIETSATDEPEKKLAKEMVNDVEKNLKEFPAIKSEIDSTFAKFKDNPDINKKIEEISAKYPENPLVSTYATAMSLSAKVQKVQIELAKYRDDLYANGEDLKGLVKSGVKQSYIDAKNTTIADIKAKQSSKSAELVKLKKEIEDAFKKNKDMVDKMRKDFSENLIKVQK